LKVEADSESTPQTAEDTKKKPEEPEPTPKVEAEQL